MNNKKHLRKGFSMIELIVVLAIIAVLASIIGLTWNNYIYRTRLRTANSKAKIVFNAAQTEAIKYENAERKDPASGYIGDGEFYFYWDGTSGHSSKTDPKPNGTASWQDKDFGSKVTRFVDVGNVYKIYINNYKVQSVVFAESDGNKYVGSYPATTDEVNASTKQPLAADSKNFTADKIK